MHSAIRRQSIKFRTALCRRSGMKTRRYDVVSRFDYPDRAAKLRLGNWVCVAHLLKTVTLIGLAAMGFDRILRSFRNIL